ncbi:MAG: tRNA lysidine(34) synthetase TilS [Chthoniobacterales bacterium]|nr:tRNA lysidine(34) synthetase TilS [Chthoniobacterales bacterium]
MTGPAPAPRAWDTAALGGFPVNARYLVGVSGGRDSVALLHWLRAQDYRKLIVCHLEHGLRGRAGKVDARFVEQIAARAKLPFEIGSDDVKARAIMSKRSIETAARMARHEFFARISRRHRCSTVFLGHHADDLVETFLLNLFRGTGSEGRRSIRSVSTHAVNGHELTLVRPWLSVWRDEIDAYVKTHALKYREDLSNKALHATRNRIRHRILPFIEKELGRNVRKSLWRSAVIAAEENALLEESMPPELRSFEKLRVASVRKLPLALQRRALRDWLRKHAVPDIGFELIESARALLDPACGPAKINLPGDRHARRRSGELFVE